MAREEEVEAGLQTLVRRLNEADQSVHAELARTLPEGRMVQVDVPDLEVSFWTRLVDGYMQPLERGSAPTVDIRLTASSDDLVAMIEGTKSLFSSYLAGHIKIQASLSDLIALRKLA